MNLYNIERQKIERMMTKDLEKMLDEHPEFLENRASCSHRESASRNHRYSRMRLSKHLTAPASSLHQMGKSEGFGPIDP